VNPVIAESLLQVCAQVIGNDAAITFGGAAGNFELNVMMPVITHNLMESITCLGNAVRMFDEKCIQGIEANAAKIDSLIEQGLMLATALAPTLGYDKAAGIAKTAFKEGATVRQIAERETDLSKDELDKILDPKNMVSS